jgi:hypothetical protein
MIRKQLNELLSATKEEIVRVLVEKYLADNDGVFPNWEDDEEIVIDGEEFPTIRITSEVYNTYDETRLFERKVINEYRVTNDGYLYFVCDEYDEEIAWDEVTTDELVGIYYNLLSKFTPSNNKRESFPCVTLSRADFNERHFDTSNISDEQMERIASKIGDTLTENLYWDCIETLGESEQMPRM